MRTSSDAICKSFVEVCSLALMLLVGAAGMGMCTPSHRSAVSVTTAACDLPTGPRHMRGVVVPSRLRTNRAATADVFVDLARGLAGASATVVGHVVEFALSPVLPSPEQSRMPVREGAGGEAYALAYQKAAATMAEGWAAALDAEVGSPSAEAVDGEVAARLRAVMHAAVQEMEAAMMEAQAAPPYLRGPAGLR